jgi:hypothetical protein
VRQQFREVVSSDTVPVEVDEWPIGEHTVSSHRMIVETERHSSGLLSMDGMALSATHPRSLNRIAGHITGDRLSNNSLTVDSNNFSDRINSFRNGIESNGEL